jgi:Tfp pilus assembly protein PilF
MAERFAANGSRRFLWLGAGVIVLAVLLVYAPHLGNGLVYDDHFQIEDNPYFGKEVSWLEPFRHEIWEHTRATTIGEAQPYYRPLLYVVYRLVFQLGGGAAWGYHLLSLLLHAACVGLSWLALRRLGLGRRVALIAGGIFALHPLAAEQVYLAANMSEELLLAGMLLALLGVSAAHGSSGARRFAWIGCALLGLGLALFAKETGVVIPPLLTLEALLRGARKEWRRRLTDVVPLWGGLFGCLAVRASVLGTTGTAGWAGISLEPVGSAGYALLWYGRQLLVPYPLTPFHSFPAGAWVVPLGLAVLALLAVIVLALLRHRPASLFWAAWLLLPLLPPFSLFFREIRPLSSLLADHNLYSALVPAAGLAVAAAGRLLQRVAAPRRRQLAAVLVGLACLASGVTSHFYGRRFASDETLFAYAYRHDPQNVTVLNVLARLHQLRNEHDQALELLQRALSINPNVAKTHYNLGMTLLQTGRPAEAAVHLQQVVLLARDTNPQTYDLLAEALRKAGNVRGAGFYYRQALVLDPARTVTRINLGMCLFESGNLGEAIVLWRQAVAEWPENEAVLFNLGMAYRKSGDKELSAHYLRRFLAAAGPESEGQRAKAAAWLAE